MCDEDYPQSDFLDPTNDNGLKDSHHLATEAKLFPICLVGNEQSFDICSALISVVHNLGKSYMQRLI